MEDTSSPGGTAPMEGEKKHITYTQQYRRCGKAACTCKSGPGHGPYWYAYWREGGKRKSAYLGKNLPEEGQMSRAHPGHEHGR